MKLTAKQLQEKVERIQSKKVLKESYDQRYFQITIKNICSDANEILYFADKGSIDTAGERAQNCIRMLNDLSKRLRQ